MSARFGRNKRRAARAAVAAAKLEVTAHVDALDIMRDAFGEEKAKRRAAERLLGEIRERLLLALGDKTALLPIDLLPKQRRTMEPWETKLPLPLQVMPFSPSDAQIESFRMREDTIARLLHLVLRVELDRYNHARDIRFINGSADRHDGIFKARGYTIGAETLQRIGFMGRDYDHLAQVIARELVDVEYRR